MARCRLLENLRNEALTIGNLEDLFRFSRSVIKKWQSELDGYSVPNTREVRFPLESVVRFARNHRLALHLPGEYSLPSHFDTTLLRIVKTTDNHARLTESLESLGLSAAEVSQLTDDAAASQCPLSTGN